MQQYGPQQYEYKTKPATAANDFAFTFHEVAKQYWLLDIVASLVIPAKEDFVGYNEPEGPIEVRIADRANMKAIGKGNVISRCKSGTMVTQGRPNLYRRLFSVPKDGPTRSRHAV